MAEELDDNFFSEEQTGFDETESIFNDDPDELDEIVIENDSTPSNRPFLLSLLGLLGVGIFSLLCLGLFSLFNTPAVETPSAEMLTQEVEIAQIVQTNEAVEIQNSYVTQTLEARENNANATATALASLPTATPVPTDTPVPTPTEAPSPTIVEQAITEGAESTGDEDPETSSEDPNSAVAESDRTTSENVDGSVDESSTDSSSANASDVSTAADTDASSASSPEQLPQTGFSIINTLVLAMGLLIVLFGARRMRQPE